MKILYIGTVCDLQKYEMIFAGGSTKPSVAPIVFESSLLAGFKENGVEVDILSFPMIPTFPTIKKIYWGNKKEKLECGYECTWLKTLNIHLAKQLSRRLNGKKLIKKWLKANKDKECAILTYSIPPFLVKDIIKCCNEFGVPCFAVVTDLLKHMYINSNKEELSLKLKNRYLEKAIKHQGDFDGYVYLTEAMKDEINPQKPYIVMEGIADVSNVKQPSQEEKSVPSVVMYAGGLNEKYGTMTLVEAFSTIKTPDVQLWLFGNGNCVDKIKDYCKKDSRIIYYGSVSREEVIRREREATLLVNVRSDSEDYTKYSFPSKTIEYMLSGTPLLTSKLPGIPSEYYEYVFSLNECNKDEISSRLEEILSLSKEELIEKGKKSAQFIVERKNAKTQSRRVIELIEKVISKQADKK